MASKVAAVQVIAVKQQHQPIGVHQPLPKEEPGSHHNNVQVHRNSDKLGKWEIYGLTRRLVIVVAAIVYLWMCTSACVGILQVLSGKQLDMIQLITYESLLMKEYAGETTMRQSPMVKTGLDDNTSPRNGTLYLEASATSFTGCTSVEPPELIYTDMFQRKVFKAIVSGMAYNLTFLNTYELIAPVVDCTYTAIVIDDTTAVRYFYLMRSLTDTNDVRMLVLTVQTGDYKIVGQTVQGPAAVCTVVFLDDLTATSVTHYYAISKGYPFRALDFEVYEYVSLTVDTFWELRLISPNGPSAIEEIIQAAGPNGFYYGSPKEQSNIVNLVWQLQQDPLLVLGYWRFTGRTVAYNTWAWVHALHFFLIIDMMYNLMVLLAVSYNHARSGSFWIGDAFVAVSSKLSMMAPIVILSWVLDHFWSLTELCIYDGYKITGLQVLFIYESIARADIMVLCFSLAGILGTIVKERIDPALSMIVFYVVYENRISFIDVAPKLKDIIVEYTTKNYNLAISSDENVGLITPMRRWSYHVLQSNSMSFLAASVGLIFSSFLTIVIVFVACRKLWRHYFPDQMHVIRTTEQTKQSNQSENNEKLLALRRIHTSFEIATGAELLDRYGFVSDYANCVYIRGVKYAAADGIYSSGFVIANGKFLVQIADLWQIWVMKITGVRFTDIYVYEVKENEAQQRARLVYPSTLSVGDLLLLNIHKLL